MRFGDDIVMLGIGLGEDIFCCLCACAGEGGE
jgi:hypothetical protein